MVRGAKHNYYASPLLLLIHTFSFAQRSASAIGNYVNLAVLNGIADLFCSN